MNKYCEGLDCAICDEKEPCIYKIANELQNKLEKECEELKKWKEDVADKFMRTCNCRYLDNKRTYCEYYKAECVAINQCLYANQDKVEKLKQVLQEIKEIARSETEERMLFADRKSFCDFSKIKQIIREVEE